MTRIAYLDESQRSRVYAVTTVAIEHSAVSTVRAQVRSLRPKQVARRHFVKESDESKLRMLDLFRDLQGVDITTVSCGAAAKPLAQRAACLDVLARRLREGGCDRLILDHVEPVQQGRDRSVLAPVFGGSGISYSYEVAHSTEPMLWIPDAVAWCVGKPAWRRHIEDWTTIIEI